MTRRTGRMRVTAFAALLLALTAGSVAAQQSARDTTQKSPQERVLERLRTLRPVAAPDTAREPDTLRAPPQQVRIEGRGQQAASGVQRDSVMEALAKLTGFAITEYKGEEAYFKADSGRLQLSRAAEVVREGQRLQADSSVVYNEKTGIACGYGRPTISGSTMEAPLTSDTVCYDINARSGVAKNAETSISQGANWKLRGDVYTVADSLFSHDAIFTDCDLPYPHQHYYFGAREVKVVPDNILVARDVTLNFADVPVFWLPFMVQSLSRGRRSGILMPRFGINDIARNSSRYARRIEDVGVYWAINDFMGAEVAMDWMSNNYTALRGSLDYSFMRQFLQGGVTFRRFFKSEGGSEFTLGSQNSWAPNEATRLGLTANYSTSSAFVSRRTLDPRELTRSIDSNLNMNRQFGWGSLTLGATRNQYLTDGSVRMTLPSVGLNLSSVTLFPAAPGSEHWFSNATWTGTADARTETNDIGSTTSLTAQNRRNTSGNLSSRFTLGKLGSSQTVRFTQDRSDARTVRQTTPRDTTFELPDATEQRTQWSADLNYQQNLIGTTTSITPSLRLNGEMLRNAKTGDKMLAAPTRMDFAASLNTAIFGFWPGVGPLSRIRHRVSPSFSYTYSPEVTADSLQRAVFGGVGGVLERNQLSIGISQTFEGKRKPRENEDPQAAAAQDSAAADTATGPRRMPAGQAPIILLSINTDAVVYDFVAAREAFGVQTTAISNSIQSDLFRALSLRFTHDLFRCADAGVTTCTTVGESGIKPGRVFDPHLSSVNASFTLNSDNWLFRLLRLGRSRTMPEQTGEAGASQVDPTQGGTAVDRTKAEYGLVGTRRRDPVGVRGGPTGTWNASLNYTLDRPRKIAGAATQRAENQMVTANATYQPTENWTVMWNTGYNVTTSEFTDHMLTLTRKLHDWDANFDFVKAQNGNFSFQFRVHLRANPDIKLDYEQHDLGALPQQRYR